MIKNLNINALLITKTNSLIKEIDLNKYNKQYNNLKVIYNDTFHDRYFIIDKKIIYHCGTSINHAGNKTFFIDILEDDLLKVSLINNLNM